MAIEGNLSDMTLTGVVQFICLERRTAELTLMRRGEEGSIYFENGEIIHARMGPLSGEEAIFHLLTWSDGMFRISDRNSGMTKTISVNWNHLLMEGMRRIDERQRDFDLPPVTELRPPLSSADIERDTSLGDDLLMLTATLEQYLPRFSDKKIQKRPALALELFAEMINRVIEQAETVSQGNFNATSLKNVIVKINEKYPQAQVLYLDKNRLSVQTAVNLYTSWASNATDRKHMFRLITQAMMDILGYYFSYLVSCLIVPNIHAEIEETFDVFTVDLRRALDGVAF